MKGRHRSTGNVKFCKSNSFSPYRNTFCGLTGSAVYPPREQRPCLDLPAGNDAYMKQKLGNVICFPNMALLLNVERGHILSLKGTIPRPRKSFVIGSDGQN